MKVTRQIQARAKMKRTNSEKQLGGSRDFRMEMGMCICLRTCLPTCCGSTVRLHLEEPNQGRPEVAAEMNITINACITEWKREGLQG